MSFKDDMKEFDTQWETDKNAPRGGRLPDGPHQTIITESRIEKRQSDGAYSWMTKFKKSEGSIRKWANLEHEVGRSIAAQDAAMMGYEGVLSDLEDWLTGEGPIGLVCEINVKTKPGSGDRDFTDVYLNRVLGKGDIENFGGAGEREPGEPGSSDDDIPF